MLSLCKIKRVQYQRENNELLKVYTETRTCYYFDYIIKLEDFDLDNILTDEKSHEYVLIYDISYKTSIYSKSLRIRFDKIDGIINRRMRYLINLKSSVTNIFSHYFAKIKVDSYDSLPIEKTLALHNVIILIK